jgi:hypothetical protein
MKNADETKNPRPFTAGELEIIAKTKARGGKIRAIWTGLACSFETTGGTIRGVSSGDCKFTITG